MTRSDQKTKWKVLSAATLVVTLAVTLAVRVDPVAADSQVQRSNVRIPSTRPIAPPARVPAPPAAQLADLPTPYCWTCPGQSFSTLEYHVDLDLLAPLGDGRGNTARFLSDFTKLADGTPNRLTEGWAARQVLGNTGGRPAKVLPGDDPLLLEAEPWFDQATCSFYPDYYQFAGPTTQVPNLLFPLMLAKSYISRGHTSEDRTAAMADYRRAVRIGRLLLQDRITLIQDLVAWAAIRLGAEAIYEEARRSGDAVTMMTASLVLGEHNAIRGRAAERATKLGDILGGVESGWFGKKLVVSDDDLTELIRIAEKTSDRPFRMESTILLHAVGHLASSEQSQRAFDALERLTSDADPNVASAARWALDAELDDSVFSLVE